MSETVETIEKCQKLSKNVEKCQKLMRVERIQAAKKINVRPSGVWI